MRLQRRKNSRFCGQSLEKNPVLAFFLQNFLKRSALVYQQLRTWRGGLERLKNGQLRPWKTDLIEMYLQQLLKHF